jgi:hypothetical protein
VRVRPPLCVYVHDSGIASIISVRFGYLTAAKRRIRHNSPIFVDVFRERTIIVKYQDINRVALIDQIQETKWVLERLLTLLQSGARQTRPGSSLTSTSPGAGIVGRKRSLEKSSKRSSSGASPLPFQVAEHVAFQEDGFPNCCTSCRSGD